MKLTMVSVRYKGVRYTGFVRVHTEQKDSKIRLTLEQIQGITGAPLRAHSCVEIGG